MAQGRADLQGQRVSSDRAGFHAQHQARAEAQAREWLAQRTSMQGAWFNWVAAQLYQLSPAEYAAMVRRELERLAAVPASINGRDRDHC
ncbi:hypothetical protein [Pseudomonas fontis]|uniref:Uncharacterized protein n=1 Tax=Pseudomonas fontis TaxID=2942633 RepID=A0ABT5NKE6_9PSED|nr:hypothetical protein [Pseudomonas fontis]MDD0976122.1 hypothetical protein [Pseudomonas fontis]MDD0989014.1 hypothetical protein [Pseudomonas fontis]